jgi:hypothetical protein
MARMDELSIEQIRQRGRAASLDQMQLSPSGAKESFEIA